MKLSHLSASILVVSFLVGCSQAKNAPDSAAENKTTMVQGVSETAAALVPGADISKAPSGTYKPDSSHAYITFQYLHQGYSRPTIRWNDFDAVIELNPVDPTASTLTVTIDANSVDSGVEKFDAHLKSGDMFDVEKFPVINFKSTGLNQTVTGKGQLTGDLTMKGITKPIVLDVTLNKVGENRGKKSMFGISAVTQIKRSDWDLGFAVPYVGDDVNITIEAEFIKEG